MRTRIVVAAVLAAATTLPLTACSGGLLAHERRGTAATTKALELAWSTPATHPEWLPADATDIRYAAATSGGADAAPAAIRATTGGTLPTSCVPAKRTPSPGISATWAPASTAHAERCGNWLVVPVRGGYYGWTPAA